MHVISKRPGGSCFSLSQIIHRFIMDSLKSWPPRANPSKREDHFIQSKVGGTHCTTFLHLLPTLTPLPPEPSTFLHPCSLALFIRSIWRRKQYRKTKFKEPLSKNWTSLLTHFKYILPFLFPIFSFHLPSVNWSARCKD